MEVPDDTFDAMNAGLAKMLAKISESGKKLDPAFAPDEPFPRDGALAKAAMHARVLDNTIGALAKAVDVAVAKRTDVETELKETEQIVNMLKVENGHLLNGDRPCLLCKAVGKIGGVEHTNCKGTGWLPKRETAPAPAKKS